MNCAIVAREALSAGQSELVLTFVLCNPVFPLRSVFVMNNSPDDEDEEDSETVVDAGSGVDVGDGSSGAGVTMESQHGGGGQHSTTDSLESPVTDDGAMAIPSMPLENGLAEVSPPSVLPPHALQVFSNHPHFFSLFLSLSIPQGGQMTLKHLLLVTTLFWCL